MGDEKVQDISWMPEINCVNIFPSFKRKLLLMSCELVIHLSNGSLQCKATSFPDAYCLIHSNTHLYITLAYSLPVQQLELQQASQRARRSKEDGRQMPPNKIQMEFNMRCLGATTIAFIALHKETKM